MRYVVVRYKVKPEHVEQNQALIAVVFKELAERDPGGIRYTSLRLDDGVSFVHLVRFETEDGSNPLAEIAAFSEFTRDIADRCDEPPFAQDATVVGSYRFFE